MSKENRTRFSQEHRIKEITELLNQEWYTSQDIALKLNVSAKCISQLIKTMKSMDIAIETKDLGWNKLAYRIFTKDNGKFKDVPRVISDLFVLDYAMNNREFYGTPVKNIKQQMKSEGIKIYTDYHGERKYI